MPLKKLTLKPGVNKENTRYTNENGWYECDKVRFRQGTPEKIGGWTRISANTFLGVCRSLWNWVTLGNLNLIALGTNLKFYIARGGAYFDITPIRTTVTINNNPFALTASTTVTVTDTAHGCVTGDFVTFSGAVDIGGVGTNVTAAVLNQEFQVTVLTVDTYTITISVTPNATAIAGSPGGGAAVVAAYQLNTGSATAIPLTGWGAGTWSAGTWGFGGTSNTAIQLWSQKNWGEDLVFGPRGGGMYYWDATTGVTTRGVDLSTVSGANGVPTKQNLVFVSDINRFVFAFGCNEIGSSVLDPMLIRWSDQESTTDWTPAATNQAGSLRLSDGSEIIAAIQARQEIVVFTDSAVYSLQYLGAPDVWGAQTLGSNISILSPNAVAIGSGRIYWMGVDKFYVYDGRIQTLKCDLRRHIFGDFNQSQAAQVFAGTNEGFNEIWWFYCSANSMDIDRYVVYNYAEEIWYYGTMARTAWLDSGLLDYPIAATYLGNIVEHENGVDDNATGTPTAINAYIESAEFDIEDGQNFGFIWRMVPDVTFVGSTANNPSLTMSLIPMKGSGSGFNNPQSLGGSSSAAVTRTATVPIEQFTNIVYIRVRGRQLIMKAESTDLGVTWQLGSPRIDVRMDGRR
jgi:hypothetical protein